MKTRCPQCGTLYDINRAMLRQASGLARCYNCGTVFNGLQRTLDGLSGSSPLPVRSRIPAPGPGTPRDLPFEVPEDLPELKPSDRVDLQARDTLHPGADARVPWWQKALFALLGIALLAQLAWIQREHWIHHPLVAQACAALHCPDFRSARPELFSVLQRDMAASPGATPTLRLQLRFRNDAEYPVPLPRLQLSLLDGNGSLVARRSLEPSEYLPATWSGPSVALAGEVIAIELTLQDPGPRVRSYVFDFV